ncbi:MAG: FABP family protein [Burkholderiales bacterium]
MRRFPKDIYTEPDDVDPETLNNLGPLRPMAGVWQGKRGLDINPKADGPERQAFIERIELQPIDPQTNGPQLLYGLRYHQHVVKPGEIATYHDQIGYWLWEPATGMIFQTLAIPRAQVALAIGRAKPAAKRFELIAKRGQTQNGISSNPFLEHAFKTVEYRIKVTINKDGSWKYDEDTVLKIRGQTKLFHHTDRSTLTRIGAPIPNPMARRKKV